MTKRVTKAETILSEARARIEVAEEIARVKQESLNIAQASLKAHKDAFSALEKALGPAPRKARERVAKDEPPAQSALPTQETETGPMCGICHHGEDYVDHSGPSPNYHAFEAPKTAKKSRAASADK